MQQKIMGKGKGCAEEEWDEESSRRSKGKEDRQEKQLMGKGRRCGETEREEESSRRRKGKEDRQ
jgi:hypothetical protein